MSETKKDHDDDLREDESGTDDEWKIVSDDVAYEDGFNSRTIWAAFFVGLIMLPGAIYLELVTGKSFAGAAEWVTIIMFIELSKRLFIKLKPQEIIILYWLAAGLAATGLGASGLSAGSSVHGSPFAKMIWFQYLMPAQSLPRGLRRCLQDAHDQMHLVRHPASPSLCHVSV